MEGIIRTHKDLIVWQKAVDLVVIIYSITENFPKTEMYGLTSQMRRAAVSIPSNIAEGRRRNTRNDFRHFSTIAFGSGAELETQIEIAKRLSFCGGLSYSGAESLLNEVMKMLNTMIINLQTGSTPYKLPATS